MNPLNINSNKTSKVFTIDSCVKSKASKFIGYLESKILAKSDYHNLMHKSTTGFGWSRNLHALTSSHLITFHLSDNIFKAYDFFQNYMWDRKCMLIRGMSL